MRVRDAAPALAAVILFALLSAAIVYYNNLLDEKAASLQECRVKLSDAQERLKHEKDLQSLIRDLYGKLAGEAEQLRQLVNQAASMHRQDAKDIKKRLEELNNKTRSEYSSLRGLLSNLGNYGEVLSRSLQSLANTCSQVEQSVGKLAGIEKQYQELMENYRRLEVNYTRLRESYSSLKSRYEKLVGAVNESLQWHRSLDRMDNGFLRALLEAARKEAADAAKKLGVSQGIPLGARLLRAFRGIEEGLYVCPDSYSRAATPKGGIAVLDKAAMLPNETLRRGCGDAEDLALLLYGVLSTAAKPGEKTYLVLLRGEDGVLAAGVLVASKVGGGNTVYHLADPAGDYLDGLALYYVPAGRGGGGQARQTWIKPVDLGPEAEKALIASKTFSRAYFNVSSGKLLTEEPTEAKGYPSAKEALHGWIALYGIKNVEKIVVIAGGGAKKEFDDPAAAARFIEQQAGK